MASSLSRLERLIKLIGDENLPSKQRDSSAAESDTTGVKHENLSESTTTAATIHPGADFPGEPDTVQWWNAAPQLPGGASRQTESIHHTAVTHPNDSHKGDPAPLGLSFTPFLAITKFPYKFVQKKWMQPLASAFFDQGKIWERKWDIYYIYSEYSPAPLTFIPEHQLLALISEINEAFPTANVTVDADLRDLGLVIEFDEFRDYPDLRPRWLGQSLSRSQYDCWLAELNMTSQGYTAGSGADERSLKAFQEKMELAIEAGKNKSKAAKAKKQSEHVAKRQNMARSLLRAQRYLGFLPVQEDSPLPDIASLCVTTSFNANEPACHPFDMDVMFIAFDVEAYERSPRQITEIGVATLDTRDLHGIAPGASGENWQKLIRARHFRIEEFKHYRNHEFVQGCPDQFEFGESEFIAKDSVGKVMSSCFKSPFSAPQTQSTDEKRKVILLGHDISQDISYLQQAGFNVLNSGNVHDKLDTVEMYRVYTKDPNARSLGSIIYDLNFTGWNLHNAGNDAVYTVWAFLAICVKSATERGSAEQSTKHDALLEKRTEAAVEQAKQNVKDNHEGWETAE